MTDYSDTLREKRNTTAAIDPNEPARDAIGGTVAAVRAARAVGWSLERLVGEIRGHWGLQDTLKRMDAEANR